MKCKGLAFLIFFLVSISQSFATQVVISQGKPVTASSSTSDGPWNLTDGNYSTAWNGGTYNAWAQIDLGESVNISSVTYRWGANPSSWEYVTLYLNGVWKQQINQNGTGGIMNFDFTDQSAQTVKINVNSPSSWVCGWEVLVYADRSNSWINIFNSKSDFGKSWYFSEVDQLNNLYTTTHTSYKPATDAKTWYYKAGIYGTNGAWGLAHATGQHWTDKYGFLHIMVDSAGNGISTSAQTAQWNYLGKVGYTSTFGDAFNENWTKSEVDALYASYQARSGSTTANGKQWNFTNTNYNGYGCWGTPHTTGNYWTDKYGYKYITMDVANTGFTTFDKTTQWALLGKIGYSSTFGETFDENWTKSEVDALYASYQSRSGSTTANGKLWNFTDTNYNSNGYWGTAQVAGDYWTDKYGYKHISVDASNAGFTTFDKTSQWALLGKIGYSSTFGEDFDENWSFSEVESLHNLFLSKIGEINIDDEVWKYIDINFNSKGFWGQNHAEGEYWVDKYGFKHIYIDNQYGEGLTTFDKEAEWSYLAKAGYSEEFGEDFAQNWDYNDIQALYDFWFSNKNGEYLPFIDIDGIRWYYTGEEFTGHNLGDYWVQDGQKYIYLGSGLTTSPVPEPLSILTLLCGFVGLMLKKRRW